MINEFVENLIEKIKFGIEASNTNSNYMTGLRNGMRYCLSLIDGKEPEFESCKQGWIPVSERLPDVETEVIVLAKRNFKGGDFRYIITTALYEDGTVLENDSIWHWNDLDGEWNEEEDCYIIPRGWWEYRHYNMDEVYNNVIDDEVIAWQPLPEPYK